jgi:hypothetical protein
MTTTWGLPFYYVVVDSPVVLPLEPPFVTLERLTKGGLYLQALENVNRRLPARQSPGSPSGREERSDHEEVQLKAICHSFGYRAATLMSLAALLSACSATEDGTTGPNDDPDVDCCCSGLWRFQNVDRISLRCTEARVRLRLRESIERIEYVHSRLQVKPDPRLIMSISATTVLFNGYSTMRITKARRAI